MGETDIVDIFLAEAKEIFEHLESDIILLEENNKDEEVINRIFRYAHTLKGSSGIAGFNNIYEFTHSLENLLDDVRAGKLEADAALIDLILDSVDWIKNGIFDQEKDETDVEESKQSLIRRITRYKGEEEAEQTNTDQAKKEEGGESFVPSISEDEEKFFKVRAYFKENIFEFGIDPLMIVEDLLSLGTLVEKRVNYTKLPNFDALDPEKCYIGWEVVIQTRESAEKIKDVFLFVDDEDNAIKIENVTSQYKDLGKDQFLRDKKIGEIMVDKGIIEETELEEVVAYQDSLKEKIGDIIVKKGYATEEEVSEALSEQEKIKKKIEVSTVRVDTGKLDNLLNLLGEIVIGQSALSRVTEEIGEEAGFRLKNALYGLDRTTREFQEQIMSIRMIPIGPTFEVYRRFVRDSSRSLGKEIKLTIEGGETELDKTVIEKIGDPLKHMIRNSIDHGIEAAEERVKAGKERAGSITLRAYHQEGNVYIEIVDDGKGISIEKVRGKAVKLGLVKPDEIVSKEKLLTFLFHPGFSTAEQVGNLSGRGVGMDVVKTNIEGLRGSVELKSEEGKGTIVRTKLPLTLAIIDGMLVGVGQHTYVVPLLSIVESMKPKKEDLKTVEGKGEVMLVRGEYVTLLRLYDIFKVDSEKQDPWDALVVIVESGNTKVGLMVDELIGEQQIVIKSLDDFITNSRAISGASILGDGRVALILDIHGLIGDLTDRQRGGGFDD
ncbi:MAG: chemotaxis protein CheA [bacterium]|nr:chemotaxis protein CheA [bacterium]